MLEMTSYRQIEGLFVIGLAELDMACRSQDPKNPNPLNLKDGWIPQIEVPTEMDEWIRSCVWRDDEEWKTRAALVLVPPEIGGIPTSLIGQNKIWGVGHDGLAAGKVRQDVFWSNWFVKPVEPNYDWANIQAVEEWRWLLAYEHPLWATNLIWDKQQKTAKERGMLISTAAQDTFVLNAVLAATGIRLRVPTWSRTSTLCGGCPLFVGSYDFGVLVCQGWFPEGAYSYVAASVQGVPLGLGA